MVQVFPVVTALRLLHWLLRKPGTRRMGGQQIWWESRDNFNLGHLLSLYTADTGPCESEPVFSDTAKIDHGLVYGTFPGLSK